MPDGLCCQRLPVDFAPKYKAGEYGATTVSLNAGGVWEGARQVYKLYGAEGNIRVKHPDSDHDFPNPVRFAAYHWIASHLR